MVARLYFEIERDKKFEPFHIETEDGQTAINKLVEIAVQHGLSNQVLRFVLWTPQHPAARLLNLNPDHTITGAITGAKVDI